MLRDFAVPAGIDPPLSLATRAGCAYEAARWSPALLGRLAERLAAAGGPALAALGRERLLAVWGETVEAFLDPGSPERRGLEGPLTALCRLSGPGLAAGLEAVLGGVRRAPAARLLGAAQMLSRPTPALVILASNLPALAVQPLLPALALGRPAILKSPSAEPLFAPAFAAALARREPRLAAALAAVTWAGGDAALEAPLLAACGTVVAYGEAESLADLARRTTGRLVAFGPKTSLAVVAAGVDPKAVAAGLSHDVALFDQRGCLSVAAVYAGGDPEALARALARALAAAARSLPPGPLDPAAAAAVQQLRAEADLRGLLRPELPLAAGTVIVEPEPGFRPSPGLRTVRVHPLASLEALPGLLGPWAGQLQGAALAGDEAWDLAPALEGLGVSRCAPPGELQSPDATWHNGGVHPLEALGGTAGPEAASAPQPS